MNETMLKRLRQIAGKSQRQLGNDAEISHQYVQQMEHEEKLMSFKSAGKMAKPLGVDPEHLFVMHNLTAVKNRAESGTVTAEQALRDLANVLKYTDESPNVVGDAEQVVLQAARSLADRLMAKPTRTMNDRLGRDSLGLSHKGKAGGAGGVRPRFANDFSAESPSGYGGMGRPESTTVADPSARSLADAVATLEDDIENGIVSRHGVLARVSQILGNFEAVDVSGDKAATDALKRLQALAADAASQITSTPLEADSGPGRKPSSAKKSGPLTLDDLGRGVGGIARKKRYS